MIGCVSRKSSTLSTSGVLKSSPDSSSNTSQQDVDSFHRIKNILPSKLVAGTLLEKVSMFTTKRAPDTTAIAEATTTTTMASYVEALSRTITCTEQTPGTVRNEEISTAKETVSELRPTASRTTSTHSGEGTNFSATKTAIPTKMSTATLTMSTVVGTAVTSTAIEKMDTDLQSSHRTEKIDTELPCPHIIDGDITKTMLESAGPGSLIRHFIDEYLVCKIHMGFFHILAHIPRMLACGHTFCEPCLRGIMLRESIIICPVCGRVTGLPPDGVNGLPEDFYTASLCVRVVDLLEDNSGKLHADIPCITTQSETAENMHLTTSDVPDNGECEYLISEMDSFVVIDEILPKQNPLDEHVAQSGPVSGREKTPRLTIINGEPANPQAKQPTRTSTKQLKRRRRKGFKSLPSILDKFMEDLSGQKKIGTRGNLIDSFNMPWV
uniref:RING-type domain-containing protein n=1 Tax=Branchiostoma floridae TaxID=7739 RepID=C3XSK6_BRAFL|eukprot:XP_002612918.1 hypothetical protein BRAFLDRAFT_94197 [Branchiostoma floridae]